MTKLRLGRRMVLKGLIGGAAISVALPPFEAFFNSTGTALADGTSLPRRFGLFFWGNGVLPARWVPSGTSGTYEGDEWSLSDQLAPLAGVKDVITVVSGMRVMVPNLIPHGSGAAGILSGAVVRPSDNHGAFTAATVDQIIARDPNVGGRTRFRSLEFGARPGIGLSYNGPNNQNPPESSPRALFNRLFVDDFHLPGADTGPDPRLGVRRSVLDAVIEDARSLESRLSHIDRQRLDQHLTSIRELEQRIAFTEANPPSFDSCAIPEEPAETYPDLEGRPQLSTINRVFCDLAAMALACDMTRVFSNYFTFPVNNHLFPGATSGHHQLTHDEPGEQPQVHAIVVQIIEELAYLIDRLRSVPEGSGTLLDNCAILATTDCSLGRTHSLDEYPLVIAGTAGGALRQGLHYRSTSGESASRVILSLIRAVGVQAESFGEEDARATSGLSAIQGEV